MSDEKQLLKQVKEILGDNGEIKIDFGEAKMYLYDDNLVDELEYSTGLSLNKIIDRLELVSVIDENGEEVA